MRSVFGIFCESSSMKTKILRLGYYSVKVQKVIFQYIFNTSYPDRLRSVKSKVALSSSIGINCRITGN